MGFDGGSGFVPGKQGGPTPPPPAGDVMVGNTLFVSSLGDDATAFPNDLTHHYATIDAAIAALTSNYDVIHVYGGLYSVNSTAMPSGVNTLNIFTPNNATRVEFFETIFGMVNLNITGEGNIIIQPQQNDLATANITASFLQCNYLLFNGGSFYFQISKLLACQFYMTDLPLFMRVVANRMEGNFIAINPENIDVEVICNEFTGLTFINDFITGNWKINIKANRIFYENSSPTAYLFSYTGINSALNKYILECPDIYWKSDTPLIRQQGGTFAFANCNFKHEFSGSVNAPVFSVADYLDSGNPVWLYLRNCDIIILNNDCSKGVIHAYNSPGLNIYIMIDGVNVFSNTKINYIIDYDDPGEYFGILGSADENVFTDWANANATNAAGLPNVQLISGMPNFN